MSLLRTAPLAPGLPVSAVPVIPVPTGMDRFGRPSYGRLPGGVPNPPNAWVEASELQTVRHLNARTLASPEATRFTEVLDEVGPFQIWMDFARQYRQRTGFVRGWVGTGLVAAGIGAAALRTRAAKSGYDRLRPFQLDPGIQAVGRAPRSAGYPSGHASTATAGATVMSVLWPARAYEFNWWARQVGLSRVHAGVHFPSDVHMGAAVGRDAGLRAGSLLWG